MTESPRFILCRSCGNLIGSCGGHRADCPVTWGHKSPTMRRILWAYLIGMALIVWGLIQLWGNGTP